MLVRLLPRKCIFPVSEDFDHFLTNNEPSFYIQTQFTKVRKCSFVKSFIKAFVWDVVCEQYFSSTAVLACQYFCTKKDLPFHPVCCVGKTMRFPAAQAAARARHGDFGAAAATRRPAAVSEERAGSGCWDTRCWGGDGGAERAMRALRGRWRGWGGDGGECCRRCAARWRSRAGAEPVRAATHPNLRRGHFLPF